MPDAKTLPLTRGRRISLRSAEDNDDDVLARLKYPTLEDEFQRGLEARRSEIEAIVRLQVGVSDDALCHMFTRYLWTSGSFNLVIPIQLSYIGMVYFRLPLPHRVSDADEKLRTEIATYAWMEQTCPDVPTPRLLGFGLENGESFTHPDNAPCLPRLASAFRRWLLRLVGRREPAHYVRRRFRNPLDSGYLILSEAEGKPLADSWMEHRHDPTLRRNLFRGLAAVLIAMRRTPLPRIGSFYFAPDGTVTLSNRPLRIETSMYESEGVPSGMPRDRTYAAAEPFISDFLTFQDNKIKHQPNSMHNEVDGKAQMAAVLGLRSTAHHFTPPELRDGPFYLSLTDVNVSNIFVDEHWNVKTMIDLEFSHSLPSYMEVPPFWLTTRPVDDICRDEDLEEYRGAMNEYLDAIEHVESRRDGRLLHTPVLRQAWSTGSFWYFQAVFNLKGMFNIFKQNIRPRFKDCPDDADFTRAFFPFWSFDASETIQRKLTDKEKYLASLREAFGCTTETTPPTA
ncbi:Uncharacterized protein TPAR_05462 [Tolypocladium paradoxum]|uniref:Aminoglycoside phosphotransferase domain-containing protein n=1 Tax=Tolypocladium paradoxum TaxID=94208 RepID=A0A2S4KVV4_9HYPO|nr:Uncharacterized protein TPAR_05462 [Tolypocladium paradoxum]